MTKTRILKAIDGNYEIEANYGDGCWWRHTTRSSTWEGHNIRMIPYFTRYYWIAVLETWLIKIGVA
jgi:hypothetical protein